MTTIARKVMWIGRATVFCVGLTVTLALIFGAAATALAAVPGDPFKLGRTNTIDEISTLVGSASGALLKVDNEGDGPALDLRVESGEAPIKVDSTTKVTSLNADKLDGNDASAFLGADEQAASATNAEEVDSKSANELVRVASFTGHSPLADGTNGTLATTEINAPSKGFLAINASSDFAYFGGNDLLSCFIKVDNAEASGSRRTLEYNGASNVNREQDCSTNSVVPVFAGPHTVDLKVEGSFGAGYRETTLSAMYVPFDGNGAQPFIVPPDLSTSLQPESKGRTKGNEERTVSRTQGSVRVRPKVFVDRDAGGRGSGGSETPSTPMSNGLVNWTSRGEGW